MKAFSLTFKMTEHIHLESFIAKSQESKGHLFVDGEFIFAGSNVKISTQIHSKYRVGDMINGQPIINILYNEEEKCFVYELDLPVDMHKYEAFSLFCLGRLAQYTKPLTYEQIRENLENVNL